MTDDEREHDRIIADCTETLAGSPADVTALNNRGLAFSKKREYDLAITDFSEAILRHPTDKALANLYYNRGRCRRLKGVHDSAIEDLTEAIRLDPQHSEACTTRGLVRQALGDYRKAIADFDVAIQSDPESADAYHNRGNAWVSLGKFRKGIADFTQTIHLDPTSAVTFTSRGIAWRRKGRYAKALADYERALELEPHSAQRRLVLGGFLACCPQRRYRDGARALLLITEACELMGYSDAEHLHFLAAAHAEQSDFPHAIAVEQKALSLATEDYDNDHMRDCLELYEAGERWRMESPSWRERWA